MRSLWLVKYLNVLLWNQWKVCVSEVIFLTYVFSCQDCVAAKSELYRIQLVLPINSVFIKISYEDSKSIYKIDVLTSNQSSSHNITQYLPKLTVDVCTTTFAYRQSSYKPYIPLTLLSGHLQLNEANAANWLHYRVARCNYVDKLP